MMIMRSKHQAGFTLLETLLTIGLLALLLAGMYGLLDTWTQRAVDRTAASDMLRVRTAAHNYVLASFDTFKTAPAGQFIEIPVNDMKPGNYLPQGYQPYNAFRQTIRVFRRNLVTTKVNTDGTAAVDAMGNVVNITTIEVVIVSDNPAGGTLRIANKRLLDTAQAGGPKMGVVVDLVMPGGSFAGLVTSVYNDWYVARSELAAAGYNATPDSIGGYLAAYDLVSSEATDANDHWLYRVDIDGRPELNRMATNLNMNGNKLQNVGTMVADKYSVTGNAAFRGITQGAPTETAQGMTVEQAIRIDSGNESRINMKSSAATCTLVDAGGGNRALSGGGCTTGVISGGEIQTIAESKVDPISGAVLSPAGNAAMGITDLRADGNVITDFTNVTGTTDTAGIATFDTIDGTTMNTTKTVLAPTANITGTQVNTVQMQVGNMNVTAGGTVGNQLVAARAEPTLTHSFTTKQMDVGNAVELTGNLIANNATATDTLYLDSVTGGYHDNAINRDVVCAPYTISGVSRVYCEPNGRTTWNGGQFIEDCSPTGTGYTCEHYRQTIYGMQHYGSCTHTRSVGANGQAYHTSSCL